MIPDSTMHKIQPPMIETWQSDSRTAGGRANKAAGSPVLATNQLGIPRPVKNVSASSTRKTVGGAKYASVHVTHTVASNDSTFHHANVWVTNLNGSSQPQLMSASPARPTTYSCQAQEST